MSEKSGARLRVSIPSLYVGKTFNIRTAKKIPRTYSVLPDTRTTKLRPGWPKSALLYRYPMSKGDIDSITLSSSETGRTQPWIMSALGDAVSGKFGGVIEDMIFGKSHQFREISSLELLSVHWCMCMRCIVEY